MQLLQKQLSIQRRNAAKLERQVSVKFSGCGAHGLVISGHNCQLNHQQSIVAQYAVTMTAATLGHTTENR